MALDSFVETLDNVEESLHSQYKQVDNGFVLDVTPRMGYALENIDGLKKTVSTLRGENSALQGKLKAWDGMDPSTVSEKLSKFEEMASIDPNKEADKLLNSKLESVKTQMSTTHKKELNAIQEELNLTTKQLKKLLIEDQAKQAIMAAGGNERSVNLLLPHVTSKMSLEKNSAGYVAHIRDEMGNPLVDGQGNNMTASQLVQQMKSEETWAIAFPSNVKSGGGMPSNTSGGKSVGSKVDVTKMSSKEKSEFIAANGLTAWQQALKQSREKNS